MYFSVCHGHTTNKKVINQLIIEALRDLPLEVRNCLNPIEQEELEIVNASVIFDHKLPSEYWSTARLEFERYALDFQLRVEERNLKRVLKIENQKNIKQIGRNENLKQN